MLRHTIVVAALALTFVPLFNGGAWHAPLGQSPLWNGFVSPQSLGVYVLLIAGAFYGLLDKRNFAAVIFTIVALVAAIVDARFAPVFALAAAPLVLDRSS